MTVALELATAYVSVVPSAQGMRRRLNEEFGVPLENAADASGDSAAARWGDRFTSGIRSVAQTAGEILTAGITAAVVVSAGLAASVVTTGVAYNTLEQQSRAALATLLGSTEAANDQMDRLRDWGRGSPFPRQAFIEGQRQLLAFGFSAEQVIPTLDGVQNAVAALGGGATEIGGVVDVLAKVRSQASFGQREMQQLGNYGINAAKLIADQWGITEEQFRETIFGNPARGQAALDIIDDLVAGMNTDFAGAADNVKNTWVGATDRVKGAWRDISSALVAPFIDPQGGGAALAWANGFADFLRDIEANLGPVVDRISSAVDGWVESAAGWEINLPDPDTLSRWAGAAAEIAPLLGAAGGAIAMFGASAIPVLGRFVPGGPILGALAGFVALSPELRGALGDLAQGFGGVMADAASSLAPVLPSISDALVRVGEAFIRIAEALLPVIPPLAALAVLLVDTIGVAIIEAFASVLEAIAGPLEVLAPFIAAVVVAVKAWSITQVALNIALTANPIGVIVMAIAALVAGIVWAYQNVDWFRDLVHRVAGFFTDTVWPAIQRVAGILGDLAVVVRDKAGQAFSWLREHVWPVLQDLGALVAAVVGRIQERWEAVWSVLGPVVAAVVDFVSEKVGAWLAGLMELWERVWPAVQVVVETVWGYIQSVIETAMEIIGAVIRTVTAVIEGDWSAAWENIKQALAAAAAFVRERIDAVAGFVRALPGRIRTAASGMWNALSDQLDRVRGWIRDRIDQVVGFVRGMPGRIRTAASGMWDGIKEAFRAVINWVIRAWNGLSFTLPSAEVFGQTIGGGTISTPNIPELHDGGIVPGRRGEETLILALAGERVTPLDDTSGPFDPDELAKAIARHLPDKIVADGRVMAEIVTPHLAGARRGRHEWV